MYRNTQREIRFSLDNVNGTSTNGHRFNERLFNHPTRHSPPEKLFAALLKRQSVRVMADITECPADTIGAHLARLDAVSETIRFAIEHGLLDPAECRPSGEQLCHPHTVADILACLEITRREHRAPVFVNSRDTQYARIEHKLDTIAGLLATNEQAQQLFTAESEAAQ